MEDILLETNNLHKSFNHVRALRGVSMRVRSGEILAVVGDNGAGKSTLIKILSGAIKPDSGKIFVNGRCIPFLTPKMAIKEGITTVYQDLSLANSRDCAANIFLGREITIGPFLRHRPMYKETRRILKDLDVDIPDIFAPVGSLSGGQQQSIAVARAIHQGGRLFVFDEPTAAMGLKESKSIQRLIKWLKDNGYAVIIISHNLRQVFELSDYISVMRHGEVVGELKTSEAREENVLAMITGTESIY